MRGIGEKREGSEEPRKGCSVRVRGQIGIERSGALPDYAFAENAQLYLKVRVW